MTPTPEMIAMAERIGRNTNLSDIFAEARRRMIGDVTQMGIDHHIATVAGERAALNAIMEVSDKVSSMADGMRTDDGSLWDAAMEDFGEAIRNGEHLR